MNRSRSDRAPPAPLGFAPRIAVEDAEAARWLAEATLRLRREVAWTWHLRGATEAPSGGKLPPLADPLDEALDFNRFDGDRARFFAEDPTARYLGERIAALAAPGGRAPRGGFGWLAEALGLAPAGRLVLALALGGVIDGARGPVIAACQNAREAEEPTLALAQRLWERPADLVALLDPAHPLAAFGILAPAPADWSAPLASPAGVARQLLFPSELAPGALAPLEGAAKLPGPDAELAAARLKARPEGRATLVPLVGPIDGPHRETAAAIGRAVGLPVLELRSVAEPGPLMVTAWLRGAAVLATYGQLLGAEGRLKLPVPGLPVVVFLAMTEGDPVASLPPRETLPRVPLVALDYAGRLALWRRALPAMARGKDGDAALTEAARRFRFEAASIDRVAASVKALPGATDRDQLFAACRSDLDLGDLAQRVSPRFALKELMLPPRPAKQIDALVHAIGALSAVHHDWGAARAWNEAGLSVLFSGPPGTGKTMAAEAIAVEVGMPIYRIDLSQVVNKYIGETEKNLRRLFDAAEAGDAMLFFDEADALFGKRTEVKDAHDRYANLEVSYLLERMERFKGTAILASNRKKDLDEAFLRRLRYIVNFPLPEVAERRRMWEAMLPEAAETGDVDIDFLAERLPLSGGHIRSAIFNACLASVVPGEKPKLTMAALLRAMKEEYDKLGRTVSLEQFGRYAGEVRDDC